jgi:hypothetical protein
MDTIAPQAAVADTAPYRAMLIISTADTLPCPALWCT